MTMTAERRYVMTRISAGDYLLPSNDQATLWRISRYVDEWEDETGRNRRVDRWAYAKYHGAIAAALDADDLLDWENWHHWGSYPTRAEAAEAAARWKASA